MLWNFPRPDPLASLSADLPPLPTGVNADGKSLVNLPAGTKSPWYTSYPELIDNRNNAFDFHIYYNKGAQMEHARKLHERIRREFPEMRIYKFWEVPVGPHPVPMFEVNPRSPAEFASLFAFLVVYRGDLSVLIHPNTDDAFRDHTDRATWMGERYPLIAFPGLDGPSGGSLAQRRTEAAAALAPAQ